MTDKVAFGANTVTVSVSVRFVVDVEQTNPDAETDPEPPQDPDLFWIDVATDRAPRLTAIHDGLAANMLTISVHGTAPFTTFVFPGDLDLPLPQQFYLTPVGADPAVNDQFVLSVDALDRDDSLDAFLWFSIGEDGGGEDKRLGYRVTLTILPKIRAFSPPIARVTVGDPGAFAAVSVRFGKSPIHFAAESAGQIGAPMSVNVSTGAVAFDPPPTYTDIGVAQTRIRVFDYVVDDAQVGLGAEAFITVTASIVTLPPFIDPPDAAATVYNNIGGDVLTLTLPDINANIEARLHTDTPPDSPFGIRASGGGLWALTVSAATHAGSGATITLAAYSNADSMTITALNVTVTHAAALALPSQNLAYNATRNDGIVATVAAAGGKPPYQYALVSLNDSHPMIVGEEDGVLRFETPPAAAAQVTARIRAQDNAAEADNHSAVTAAVTVNILAPLALSPINTTMNVYDNLSDAAIITLTVSGGQPPIALSVSDVAADFGAITAAAGEFVLTVARRAFAGAQTGVRIFPYDADGYTLTQTLTLNIIPRVTAAAAQITVGGFPGLTVLIATVADISPLIARGKPPYQYAIAGAADDRPEATRNLTINVSTGVFSWRAAPVSVQTETTLSLAVTVNVVDNNAAPGNANTAVITVAVNIYPNLSLTEKTFYVNRDEPSGAVIGALIATGAGADQSGYDLRLLGYDNYPQDEVNDGWLRLTDGVLTYHPDAVTRSDLRADERAIVTIRIATDRVINGATIPPRAIHITVREITPPGIVQSIAASNAIIYSHHITRWHLGITPFHRPSQFTEEFDQYGALTPLEEGNEPVLQLISDYNRIYLTPPTNRIYPLLYAPEQAHTRSEPITLTVKLHNSRDGRFTATAVYTLSFMPRVTMPPSTVYVSVNYNGAAPIAAADRRFGKPPFQFSIVSDTFAERVRITRNSGGVHFDDPPTATGAGDIIIAVRDNVVDELAGGVVTHNRATTTMRVIVHDGISLIAAAREFFIVRDAAEQRLLVDLDGGGLPDTDDPAAAQRRYQFEWLNAAGVDYLSLAADGRVTYDPLRAPPDLQNFTMRISMRVDAESVNADLTVHIVDPITRASDIPPATVFQKFADTLLTVAVAGGVPPYAAALSGDSASAFQLRPRQSNPRQLALSAQSGIAHDGATIRLTARISATDNLSTLTIAFALPYRQTLELGSPLNYDYTYFDENTPLQIATLRAVRDGGAPPITYTIDDPVYVNSITVTADGVMSFFAHPTAAVHINYRILATDARGDSAHAQVFVSIVPLDEPRLSVRLSSLGNIYPDTARDLLTVTASGARGRYSVRVLPDIDGIADRDITVFSANPPTDPIFVLRISAIADPPASVLITLRFSSATNDSHNNLLLTLTLYSAEPQPAAAPPPPATVTAAIAADILTLTLTGGSNGQYHTHIHGQMLAVTTDGDGGFTTRAQPAAGYFSLHNSGAFQDGVYTLRAANIPPLAAAVNDHRIALTLLFGSAENPNRRALVPLLVRLRSPAGVDLRVPAAAPAPFALGVDYPQNRLLTVVAIHNSIHPRARIVAASRAADRIHLIPLDFDAPQTRYVVAFDSGDGYENFDRRIVVTAAFSRGANDTDPTLLALTLRPAVLPSLRLIPPALPRRLNLLPGVAAAVLTITARGGDDDFTAAESDLPSGFAVVRHPAGFDANADALFVLSVAAAAVPRQGGARLTATVRIGTDEGDGADSLAALTVTLNALAPPLTLSGIALAAAARAHNGALLTLTALFGAPPYAFNFAQNPLPAAQASISDSGELSINAAGVALGDYVFIIAATDAAGAAARATLTLIIAESIAAQPIPAPILMPRPAASDYVVADINATGIGEDQSRYNFAWADNAAPYAAYLNINARGVIRHNGAPLPPTSAPIALTMRLSAIGNAAFAVAVTATLRIVDAIYAATPNGAPPVLPRVFSQIATAALSVTLIGGLPPYTANFADDTAAFALRADPLYPDVFVLSVTRHDFGDVAAIALTAVFTGADGLSALTARFAPAVIPAVALPDQTLAYTLFGDGNIIATVTAQHGTYAFTYTLIANDPTHPIAITPVTVEINSGDNDSGDGNDNGDSGLARVVGVLSFVTTPDTVAVASAQLRIQDHDNIIEVAITVSIVEPPILLTPSTPPPLSYYANTESPLLTLSITGGSGAYTAELTAANAQSPPFSLIYESADSAFVLSIAADANPPAQVTLIAQIASATDPTNSAAITITAALVAPELAINPANVNTEVDIRTNLRYNIFTVTVSGGSGAPYIGEITGTEFSVYNRPAQTAPASRYFRLRNAGDPDDGVYTLEADLPFYAGYIANQNGGATLTLTFTDAQNPAVTTALTLTLTITPRLSHLQNGQNTLTNRI